MAGVLLHILADIVGPILLLIAAGVWARRKFHTDVGALAKLNLYLFTPAFVFRNVATAELRGETMAGIVLASVILSLAGGAAAYAICRAADAKWATTSAVMLGTMIYNSGNFGVPLATLAYGDFGQGVQAFVLSTQSVLTFTVGLALAGSAAGGGVRTITAKMLRLPILYALAAAIGFRLAAGDEPVLLPTLIDKASLYLAGALVPIALITLGAQLASAPRWPRWRPVGTVIALRLVAAPVGMTGLLFAAHHFLPGSVLDLWPSTAAVLIVTAGVPTAVNTLLLTLEMKGDDRLSGDAVFWTTVLSPITICTTLALVRPLLTQ